MQKKLKLLETEKHRDTERQRNRGTEREKRDRGTKKDI